MREFSHYFRPSGQVFDDLWKHCSFAFDASVLLNVYGYSDSTREAMLGLLVKIQSRLTLPHQFGLEFSRNRAGTIVKQIGNCRQALETLERFKVQHLDRRTEHPFLAAKSLESFTGIIEEIRSNQKTLEKLVSEDEYASKLLDIFEGRVTAEYDEQKLREIYDEGKRRYALLTPPGFADLKEKGEPRAFGDLVGWRQLMEFAKSNSSPVILVTDDSSEDWWQLEGTGKRTIGPRPELLKEFVATTAQQFYMYNSFSFLKLAAGHLGIVIDAAVVEEVQEHLERIREDAVPAKADSNESNRQAKAEPYKPLADKPKSPMAGSVSKPEAQEKSSAQSDDAKKN